MTDILSRLMPSQRKEFDALIAASKWIAAVQQVGGADERVIGQLRGGPGVVGVLQHFHCLQQRVPLGVVVTGNMTDRIENLLCYAGDALGKTLQCSVSWEKCGGLLPSLTGGYSFKTGFLEVHTFVGPQLADGVLNLQRRVAVF